MDKEFVEMQDAISAWTIDNDGRKYSEQSISFHEREDGRIMVKAAKGAFEYRLKPLQELFSPAKADRVSINTDDPRHLQLLHAIEGEIKRRYEKDRELTDSSVMLALDRLA